MTRRRIVTTPRTRLIASIHALAQDLGLDEDTRRDLMARETGLRSAADMNDGQLAKVVGALSTMKGAAGRDFQPHADPGVRLVHALWREGRGLGVFKAGRPDGFVAALVGIDRTDWLHRDRAALDRVIQTLRDRIARAKDAAKAAPAKGDPT
jgi:hypothetical protein